jgi:hypothetical protein
MLTLGQADAGVRQGCGLFRGFYTFRQHLSTDAAEFGDRDPQLDAKDRLTSENPLSLQPCLPHDLSGRSRRGQPGSLARPSVHPLDISLLGRLGPHCCREAPLDRIRCRSWCVRCEVGGLTNFRRRLVRLTIARFMRLLRRSAFVAATSGKRGMASAALPIIF